MAQKNNIFDVHLVKKNGKLVHRVNGTQVLYEQFVESLEEGQVVEAFFEAHKDDGTNGQLAKIHASIRQLAVDIGYTFPEMKRTIKEMSGLRYKTKTGYYEKSFADCSKEELGLAVEAIEQAFDHLLPDQG